MERAVNVLGDIKDLSEMLQGASLDQVHLAPSGGRLRLELELTRACAELQPAGRVGFSLRRRVPWVKSRLVLTGISDASVQRIDDGSPAQTSLLVCDAVTGGYTLSVTSHDGLRLVLTLDRLSGEFRDVGKPVESP